MTKPPDLGAPPEIQGLQYSYAGVALSTEGLKNHSRIAADVRLSARAVYYLTLLAEGGDHLSGIVSTLATRLIEDHII